MARGEISPLRYQLARLLPRRAGLVTLLALILAIAATTPASAGEGTWTRVGLAGKQITTVAVDPADSKVLLAGTSEEGLYRSVDRTRAWTKVTLPVPSRPNVEYGGIGDVAFDPQSSSIVYVASSVLHRSDDGGKTWTQEGAVTPKGGAWPGIAISPSSPNIVYLGVYDEGTGSKILKSTDRGQTWQDSSKNVSGLWVRSVAVHPSNPDLVIASGNGGLVRTTNGGASWTPLRFEIGNLIFDRSGTSILLGADGQVLRSTDLGDSWTTVLKGADEFVFATDPLNGAEVFAASGRNVYRSADSGRSFARLSASLGDQQVSALAVDTANPRTLYVATNDGLWAYTVPARTEDLPRTGEPFGYLLPFLLWMGAALVLLGARLHFRSRKGPTSS